MLGAKNLKQIKQVEIGLKGNAAGLLVLGTLNAAGVLLALDQILLLLIWLVTCYFFLRSVRSAELRLEPTKQILTDIPNSIAQVMNVTDAQEENGIAIYSGKLICPSNEAYKKLKIAYSNTALPMLQDTWSGNKIIILPGQLDKSALHYTARPAVHIVLAIITIISTTIAGAHHLGYKSMSNISELLSGLSYSLPLLFILGIHETGHFVLAKMHGMIVTPPFFIPLPFGLGTMGAFIQVKSPAVDRKSLFDMAVAGPLAGFIASIPIVLLGLQNSTIIHPQSPQIFITSSFWEQTPISSSILLSLLAGIACGDKVQYGDLLKLNPLALAGWIGLWVTAFNLLPIGQLDGGHVAQSMFGSKWSVVLTRIAMLLLFFLSIFVWSGFLVWLIILYIIARQTVPPLDDITPIRKWRMILGWAALSLIVLIFAPVPPTPVH